MPRAQGVYPPFPPPSPPGRGAFVHNYRYLEKNSFVKRAGRLPDFDTDLKENFRHNLPFDGEGGCRERKRFKVEKILAVFKQTEMRTLREWCRGQDRGEHISEAAADFNKDPPDAVNRANKALYTESEEGHSAPI